MQINLWEQFAKKKNSTKLPPSNLYISTNVVLKEPTSVESPVFLMTIGYRNFNYLEVPDWHRYYYITDIIYVSDSLCELHCTCDYYATFRNEIRGYTAFVERTSHPSYYNTDLHDSALSVEDVVEHTASAKTDCGIASDVLYIVRIMGRDSSNGVGTFVMNKAQFNRIFSSLWGNIDTGSVQGDVLEFLQVFISNPAQYIVGVYTSPIGASTYAHYVTNETIYVGGHETDAKSDRVNNGNAIIKQGLVLNKPTSLYSDFRKTDSAFSQYSIYLPCVGTCPLSADVMDTTLTLDVSADLYSGDLLYVLKSSGTPIASYNTNCYASLSVGTMNEANSIFSGASQTALSVLTANPIGAIEGIRNGFSSTPSIIGTQGGTGCVVQNNEVVISCLQKTSAEFPVGVYGRPCCRNLQLSVLDGYYVKCGNASVVVAGYESDKDAVNNGLNSGLYIE